MLLSIPTIECKNRTSQRVVTFHPIPSGPGNLGGWTRGARTLNNHPTSEGAESIHW